VIQIHENSSGMDHVGIINRISGILTKNNIPILYINTFNNNYILVKEQDFDLTTSIFKETI
jgi:hypothetical protein